jgi:site-specific DNA-methyltransferase (adenine-specific)
MNLKIWNEVQEQLGPLAKDRFDALAQSIRDLGYHGPPVYCLPDGRIIDGHHRFEIMPDCPVEVLDVDEAMGKALAFAHNMNRRQLNNEQIKEIRKAQRKTALQLRAEGKTLAEAAAAVGVHLGTVDRWEAENANSSRTRNTSSGSSDTTDDAVETEPPDVRVKLSPEQKKGICGRLESGETQEQVAADFCVSRQRLAQLWKAHQTKVADEKRRTKEAADTKIPQGIIVGDFREHIDRIPAGTVDLIFTDPPYDRDSLEMYGHLAEFGAAKLREGGSLVVYCGIYLLPDIFNLMNPHLRYWWTFASIYDGPSLHTTMREYGVTVCWKPLLWYVKGTRGEKTRFVNDVLSSKKREKDTHPWQQSIAPARVVIESLCPKNGLVCDPFLGGGTTAVASNELNRRWVGFEIDKETARRAAKRIEKHETDPHPVFVNRFSKQNAYPIRCPHADRTKSVTFRLGRVGERFRYPIGGLGGQNASCGHGGREKRVSGDK